MKTQTHKHLLSIAILLFSFIGIMNASIATSGTGYASSGTASQAIDGNMGTRWESDQTGADVEHLQWYVLALDQVYTLSEIDIYWEAARADIYSIDISTDSTNWTEAFTTTEGEQNEKITDLSVDAKYIRINCNHRALNNWGYSIYEIELAGSPQGTVNVLNSIELSADKARVSINEDMTITANGKSEDNYDMATTPVWSSNGGTIADGVFSANTTGTYTITATEGSITQTIEVFVGNPQITGTTASDSDDETKGDPSYAVDGDEGTRWESSFTDTMSICIDLKTLHNVSEIRIYWQNAASSVYGLDFSTDSINWTNIDSITDGASGGRWDIFFPSASPTRYVRVNASDRATAWGHSIYEFQVFGTEDVSTLEPEMRVASEVEIYNYRDEITLKNLTSNHSSEIKIYSIAGQLVDYKKVNNDNMTFTSTLKSGNVYLVSVDGDIPSCKKIVVQ